MARVSILHEKSHCRTVISHFVHHGVVLQYERIWFNLNTCRAPLSNDLYVDCHRELARQLQKLSLRIDPCATFPLLESAGSYWSVRHGNSEDYSEMGSARQDAHPRDCAPDRVSRNTIKKYLRTGIVEPEFQILDRPSKLDPYADKLTDWLLSEQRKSRKERRTAKQPLVTLPLAMHCQPVDACGSGSARF